MVKSKEQLIAELLEAERRFTTLLEHVRLASIMIDREKRIIFINNHFCEITGYSKEEVMGRSYFDIFVSHHDRKRLENIHALCMAGMWEPLSYVETNILTKQGSILAIAWNNTVLRDSRGKIIATNSIGEELSKGKKIPAEVPVKVIAAELKESEPSFCNKIGDYEIAEAMGKNSKVRIGIHKDTREKVAIKILRKDRLDETELIQARREIYIMEKLTAIGNPFIAKLYQAVETQEHFYIIMEYAENGEMLPYILKKKGLTEEESHKFFHQIISALRTCHSENIVHRDIKHQNILLDSNFNAKLIDFGLSNFVEEGTLRTTFCGTPAYAAPEILLGTKYDGPEVDIWSLGVVLYSMLTAEFPFKTVSDILAGQFEEPNTSPECIDLLKKLLTVERKNRATLNDVLNHPWTKSWVHNCPLCIDSFLGNDLTDNSSQKRRKV